MSTTLRNPQRFSRPALPRRRVVVTGVGAVTPLAVGARATWDALLARKTNVRRLEDCPGYLSASQAQQGATAPSISAMPCQIAMPVISNVEDKRTGKMKDQFAATGHNTRYALMAMSAVEEALADSGLTSHIAKARGATDDAVSSSDLSSLAHGATCSASYVDGSSRGDSDAAGGNDQFFPDNFTVDPRTVGVNIGIGIPSLQDISDVTLHLLADPQKCAYNKVSPYFVPKILGNIVSGQVAMKYDFRGPNQSNVTACATGAHCIGDAMRTIERGDCDVVICGAAEACITPVSIGGFARMRALCSKHNGTPGGAAEGQVDDMMQSASRPFDASRCGFVMGEGAGIVVLESYEFAMRRRAANIYCEVAGYGCSGDAHHISAPHPDGRGAALCVDRALYSAGVSPADVAYVNAHATSTPVGDEIELGALGRVIRPETASSGSASQTQPPVVVSSSKGAFGHMLGAAGAVEAIMTTIAVQDGVAPPNVNLAEPIAHDTARVALNVEPTALKPNENGEVVALSTSFGFGGTNAALVLSKAAP